MSLARLMQMAGKLFRPGQKQPPPSLLDPPPQPPNPPRVRRGRAFVHAPPVLGPPSYETIMRRFLVGPSPYRYYMDKWADEGVFGSMFPFSADERKD